MRMETKYQGPKVTKEIKAIVRRALREDLGALGDVTSEAIVVDDLMAHGEVVVKEDGVIAGLQVAGLVFETLDRRVSFRGLVKEGSRVRSGEIVAEVDGSARSLLGGERVALNFLQRMSGIATATSRFMEAVKPYKADILDTRKTAPGLRVLDKWAVAIGGGKNHRMGLYDMVLVKDNHVALAGSVTKAVEMVRRNGSRRKIEVEVKTIEELREALAVRPTFIMLDNMSLETMRQAVEISGGRVPLEASGRISLQNVAEVAATGVDYISVGALTHSVKALDISLEIKSQR